MMVDSVARALTNQLRGDNALQFERLKEMLPALVQGAEYSEIWGIDLLDGPQDLIDAVVRKVMCSIDSAKWNKSKAKLSSVF